MSVINQFTHCSFCISVNGQRREYSPWRILGTLSALFQDGKIMDSLSYPLASLHRIKICVLVTKLTENFLVESPVSG